jgi:hypothetical protein
VKGELVSEGTAPSRTPKVSISMELVAAEVAAEEAVPGVEE